MKKKIISDAITNISSEYIEKAADYTVAKKSRKPVWIKWGAMAACLALICIIAIPLVEITQDKLPTEDIQMIEFNNAFYEVCDDNSVLERLGINKNISKEDAGEIVTYLTQKTPGGKSEYIPTENKTDIILYSYVDVPCEAVYVICDKGKYNAVVFCNYRLPNSETISLEKVFNVYGIKNASDILSISVVDDSFKKNVVGTVLNDTSLINDFYSISLTLQDYNNDEYHKMNYGHITVEEELLEAYKQTQDNTITIMITTANGLRFCLDYDIEGGWIYSSPALRYYQVTDELTNWFSSNIQ